MSSTTLPISVYKNKFVLPVSVYQDKSYNKLRRGNLILIATLLEKYITEEDDINNYENMIIAIEKSCYEDAMDTAEQELLHQEFDCPQFECLYRTKVMRITKNLDIESEVGDDYLATSLLSGNIDPTLVSRLDNKDLCPAKNEKLLEQLNIRLNQHITLKTSTLYKCHKCHRNQTTIKSIQMRSLDEPSTLAIQCTFCGYKWFS